jgi:hypothetical protein
MSFAASSQLCTPQLGALPIRQAVMRLPIDAMVQPNSNLSVLEALNCHHASEEASEDSD